MVFRVVRHTQFFRLSHAEILLNSYNLCQCSFFFLIFHPTPLNFNHPLAGQTLHFDVEIMEVREATEEELSHGHVHGEGGHQH